MIKFPTYKGAVYTLKKDISVAKGRSATLLKAGTTVHFQTLKNGKYFYA
jgi:hypothetical protein